MKPSFLPRFCSGPIPRRSFLEVGGLSVLGLGMSDFLRMKAEAKDAGGMVEDKSVIFIWLPGGMPHMDTYDMKPESPSEYRGDFSPIRTNVPGIEVCELMPMHAKIADKFAIIRSMHHDFTDHGGATKRMMTGRPPKTPTGTINDAPAVPCIVKKMLSGSKGSLEMPISVAGQDGINVDQYALGSAYLGPANTPFLISGNPNDPNFKVNNIGVKPEMENRLDDRLAMLKGMDQFKRSIDKSGSMAAMDTFNAQAMEMLMSEDVRRAFDLNEEPDSVRDRYGRSAYGQRGLLARRLIEAGSRFVTMVWQSPFSGGIPKNATGNWDCHAVNCHVFDDLRWRLPVYDQALSALIEDLYQRGLDEKVMLVVGSDFGHTPKISTNRGNKSGVMQPGRDHWPKAMSVLVSGGNMPMGQLIGATNDKGEHPVERVMTPNDLWATVYQHLDIDYNQYIKDLSGLPRQILPFGKPIKELAPMG